MEKQTVSFRLASDKVSALDALADSLDRDRTYLLGEAVQAYLDTQQWHLEQIRAGIADADAGRAAEDMLDRIFSTVEILQRFPEAGRPGRVAGTRELVIVPTPFLVAYRIHRGTIEILSLLHGARKWPERF